MKKDSINMTGLVRTKRMKIRKETPIRRVSM